MEKPTHKHTEKKFSLLILFYVMRCCLYIVNLSLLEFKTLDSFAILEPGNSDECRFTYIKNYSELESRKR